MALQYTFRVPMDMLANIKGNTNTLTLIVGWRQYNVKHVEGVVFHATYTAKDVKDACAAQRELTAKGIASVERQV